MKPKPANHSAAPQRPPISRWRGRFAAFCAALMFGALALRVLSLQVLETDYGYHFLQSQGAARHLRTEEIPAHRGIITDRRGEPLAVSAPVISLWAHPPSVLGAERLAELAAALEQDAAALRERLHRYRGKSFMYLRRRMPPDAARAVLALGIPGVHGQREYQRYYPAGAAVAHLVGLTDVDERGIEGMELAWDERLRGRPGRKRVIKDFHGEVARDIGELEPARPGRDLALSIDLRLQHLARRELQRAIADSRARSGSVVMLDARTGEVLALANHPGFNPNQPRRRDDGYTRNRAVTDVFEPGSTMKPLTLAAALESGRFTRDTVIDTSPGRIAVGRKVLEDPQDYGELEAAAVVARSSQVGIVKMALALDEQALWNTFDRFGLGRQPGTGFPGESAGVLPYRSRWRPIERATLSYGYGLAVTPLQLARAYAVLASGGRLLNPSLTRLDRAPPAPPQVLEPRVAAAVLQSLQRATSDIGTARRARIAGYAVAGKTGTARKVGRDGYSEDRYLAFFAGIAPAESPRLVTVVLIDEPGGGRYSGGQVAAPAFARISGEALRLLNVLPGAAASPAVASALELAPAARQVAAAGRAGGAR